MAIVIKVLDKNTKKPKSGIRVSYSYPLRREPSTYSHKRWIRVGNRDSTMTGYTDKSGSVYYNCDQRDNTIATLIIDDQVIRALLKNGENVFCI